MRARVIISYFVDYVNFIEKKKMSFRLLNNYLRHKLSASLWILQIITLIFDQQNLLKSFCFDLRNILVLNQNDVIWLVYHIVK